MDQRHIILSIGEGYHLLYDYFFIAMKAIVICHLCDVLCISKVQNKCIKRTCISK